MNKTLRTLAVSLLTGALLVSGCRTPPEATMTPTRTALPPPTATLTPAPPPTSTSVPSPTPTAQPTAPAWPEDLPEWSFPAGGAVISSPVADEGTVYFGDLPYAFHAVDLRSGEEKWHLDVTDGVFSSPAVVDGVVYFGGVDGNLYAVDVETGEVRWQFATQGPIVSSPAVEGGLVYVGSDDHYLYAVDAASGEERWRVETGAEVEGSPAVAAGVVYVGGHDGAVYAVDAATGEVAWQFTMGAPAISRPAIVDGVAYVGSFDGKVYAIDLASHQARWEFATPEPVISSPAVEGGVVYVGGYDGNFYALDAETGEEVWQFPTGGPIISSPDVADGRVYFGSSDGRVYALDAATGQEGWRFQAQGEVWSSPAVVGNVVYAGSHDGHLYALDRHGPQFALAPTPTPRPLEPTLTPLPELEVPVTTGTEGMPWWNDRVFYEIFVRSFYDSDGDGIGDLQGLVSELDYLNDGDPTTDTDLGITGIWLMPVAESPSYHGYDVVDYRTVEQDYGTNDDLRQFIAAAHERGIAVIVDLVMNHTSNQHPWFVDAQTPGSEYESWYVWRTERPTWRSPWGSEVWHPSGLRYYYGLFWSGMPDLNYDNGAVTEEMFDIIRFWLEDVGVDGFRLDAVRHMIEDGEILSNTPATHAWLQNFHRYVRSISPDALAVGEVWDETAEVVKYIGDEVDLAFEFSLAGATLESAWRGNNRALVQAQEEVLQAYPKGRYATFLTNHDQNRVMTQVRNDVAAAKVAATLLLTSPSVPFIYYGEEVGMRGAKPDERIRTPMQWDTSESAGFTTGTPWEELASNHQVFNVAVQNDDPDSLLNHYRALIHLRQDHPALRVGDMLLVESDAFQVYSFLRHGAGETILVVVNLSDEPVSDYQLALKSGPLVSVPGATLLLGEGQPVAPAPNAAGGFDAYVPLPTLAPQSSTVIQLTP